MSSSPVATVATPSFADLGVPDALIRNLHAQGIDAPFPIQASTIPDALAGRDVSGRAPTGSGKTIAFGVPLVAGAERAKPRRPRSLVLVPTRELASQVTEELRILAGHKGPSVGAIYGGTGFDRQIKAMRRGTDILVACPGRLADLIGQGHIQLTDVTLVVLDEADRMADMGFLPEVRRLLDQCRADRQTLLFSATLDGDVDVLVRRYQKDPVRHEVEVDDDIGDRADHHFWSVDRTARVRTTAAVIQRIGPTVVFCRTKRGADRLATQLETSGVRAAAIHGNRSQGQRERALQAFHDGHVQALVATDVAARGIHVDNVAGVVHYDPPGDEKDYVHRSGRTARAGKHGVVVSLVPTDLAKAVRSIQRALDLPQGVERADVDSLPLGEPVIPRERPSRSRPQTVADVAGGARRRGRPAGPHKGRGRRPRTERGDQANAPSGANARARANAGGKAGSKAGTKPSSKAGARAGGKRPNGSGPRSTSPSRGPKSAGKRSASAPSRGR